MRTSLVVIIATALVGAVCADCDACLDGNCYRKHSLPKDTGGYEAINRNTNTFYSTSNFVYPYSIILCNLTEEYNVDEFIVDKKDDIYFMDKISKFIRKLKKGAVNASDFCVRDEHKLSIDKDDNAMVLDKRSHAFYRVTDDHLVEVGAVKDWVSSPLFDGDNNLIVVHKSHAPYERYYLKKVTDVQCSTEKGVSEFERVITETIRTTTPKSIEPTTMFTYTTVAQETSSSGDDSNPSGSSQQQTNQERHQDQNCTCNTSKLPTVIVKIEFN